MASTEATAFEQLLGHIYLRDTVGVIAFVALLAVLEQTGLPRRWIGVIFPLAAVGLYAAIRIISRTTGAAKCYVAGRRVTAS